MEIHLLALPSLLKVVADWPISCLMNDSSTVMESSQSLVLKISKGIVPGNDMKSYFMSCSVKQYAFAFIVSTAMLYIDQVLQVAYWSCSSEVTVMHCELDASWDVPKTKHLPLWASFPADANWRYDSNSPIAWIEVRVGKLLPDSCSSFDSLRSSCMRFCNRLQHDYIPWTLFKHHHSLRATLVKQKLDPHSTKLSIRQ